MLTEIDPQFRQFAERERTAALHCLEASLRHALWVNGYNSSCSAENRFRQMLIATELGFEVPDSLLTNAVDEMEDFRRSARSVIIKPLIERKLSSTGTGLYMSTSRLAGDVPGDSKALSVCPVFLQEETPKKLELRINVIGHQVLAAAIYSQDPQLSADAHVDYRNADYSKLLCKPYSLPEHIEEQCRKLTERLDLRTCAIDMIVTPDERFVFLEANADFQWLWIERMAGQPITEALAEYLVTAR